MRGAPPSRSQTMSKWAVAGGVALGGQGMKACGALGRSMPHHRATSQRHRNADSHGGPGANRFLLRNRHMKRDPRGNLFPYDCISAAFAVLLSRQAMVIGPTPPGTGVTARAWSSSCVAQSPTIFVVPS